MTSNNCPLVKLIFLGFRILIEEDLTGTGYKEILWSIKSELSKPNSASTIILNEKEALKAVEIIKPKRVIPCHYNCLAFFSKKFNPANAVSFKKSVENLGIPCNILLKNESIEV